MGVVVGRGRGALQVHRCGHTDDDGGHALPGHTRRRERGIDERLELLPPQTRIPEGAHLPADARQFLSVQIRDDGGEDVLIGVAADHIGGLRAEGMPQRRPPLHIPARSTGVGHLPQPSGLDQVTAQRKHGGARQSRALHELGGRHRLARPGVLEQTSAVEHALGHTVHGQSARLPRFLIIHAAIIDSLKYRC
nr:hypothetical protein [Nesterenkonia sp. PF2B19]